MNIEHVRLRKSYIHGFPAGLACAFLMSLLCFGSVAHAQSISGITGTVAHGASITINGANFGTKPVAAPVIWDNFETGSFNPAWSGTGYPAGLLTVAPSGGNARHANSRHNTSANFRGTDGWATLSGGTDSPKWFVQHWIKFDNNWDWGTNPTQSAPGSSLANVKIFRLWTSGSEMENFVLAAHGWENAVAIKTEYTEESPYTMQYMEAGYMQNWTKGVWHLWQFEFQDSDQRVNNGIFRWWIDGELRFSTTNWMTREDFPAYKRVYGLGLFNSNGDSSTDDNHFYMDDAYIDNSWARVEIGNASTYAACRHREIQVPTRWETNRVDVSVNTGSFQNTAPMYLFVINSSGQVSNGFPVSLSGGDSIAPGAPQNLTVR